ncbi:MAG: thrombospondin type 3 repeat-containing protein [Nanoarchaeota archaeon]
MKNIFLFFIVLVLMSSIALAIPVTYVGTIEYDSDSTNTLKAVSTTGTTEKDVQQTALQTQFVLNHLANPNENVEFYFKGLIVRRYTQPLPGTIITDLGNILIDIKDSDQDGTTDEDDTCPFVANIDQIDTDDDGIGNACQDDSDGDGTSDDGDKLIGNEDLITTNIGTIDLKIGGDTNTLDTYDDKELVEITDGTDTIVEFNFDFSIDDLSMANITIQKQEENSSTGGIIISGIDLTSQGTTKTVYVDRKAGEDYVCVKDAEIASITELPSTLCSGAGEIPVPCSTTGSSASGFTCTITGNKFKVEGLKHSGISESTYTPASAPSGGGGGGTSSSGGGGGSGYDWGCTAWTECASSGTQTRTCTQILGSGAPPKPAETQSCAYTAPAPVAPSPAPAQAPKTTTTAAAPKVTSPAPTAPKPTGFAAFTGNVISTIAKPSVIIAIMVAAFVITGIFVTKHFLYKKKN